MPRPRPLLLLLLLVPLAWGEPALVVNPDVTQRSIDRDTLRAIFGMRRSQWPDGRPIRVFVLPDRAPLHREFCKRVLGVFPHQLRRAWDRAVFSGTGQAPEQLDGVEAMRRRIAETPGAIGYLPEERIDERVRRLDLE